MIPYQWPVARAVPQNPEVQLDIARAARSLIANPEDAARRRAAEIASIRSDLERITQTIATLHRDAYALVRSELRKYGYNPQEPRIPKRNTGGGRWTAGEAEETQIAGALIIKHPRAYTGDPRIDNTTDKLVAVLNDVMQAVEYAPSMTPQRYGQIVHQEFAKQVKAAGLDGIGPNDVETTFPTGLYGSPGSIRTDVVLRAGDGNIIAIYDVKTGAADLTPARAAQLRTKARVSSDTPVIQVRFDEAVSKFARSIFIQLA